MAKKGPLKAIIEGKCPRCREGNMFLYPISNLRKFGAMHENCPHCGHRFEQEPGFYYGAMYVSYALSVGIFLATVFVLYVFVGDPSLETYIISISAVALLLYPFTFRYSRIIFTYVFGGVTYDPKKSK
ncbi:conserved hypothetical protein [Marinoscillum sp. 108]|nr:conserved hypothetical protein [Marinoscillum sp. 108]